MREFRTFFRECWREALGAHERVLSVMALITALLGYPVAAALGGVPQWTVTGLFWISLLAFCVAVFLLFVLAPFRRWKDLRAKLRATFKPRRNRWIWQAAYYMAFGVWLRDDEREKLDHRKIPDLEVDPLLSAAERLRVLATEDEMDTWGVPSTEWSEFHPEIDPKQTVFSRIDSDYWYMWQFDLNEFFSDPKVGHPKLYDAGPNFKPASVLSAYYAIMVNKEQVEVLKLRDEEDRLELEKSP